MMTNIVELIENLKFAMGGGKKNTSFFLEPSFDNIFNLASNITSFNLLKSPVGVCVEQDTQSVELMLAVAYSGNFYVPIDGTLPQERLELLLSELKLFLCKKSQLTDTLKEILQKNQIPFLIYEDCLQLNLENKDKLESIKAAILPSDPLFMVYTSGSTGKPKGVLKSHEAILAFVERFTKEFKLDENDTIANQTPLYFDASSKDIYLSLFTGAKLIFVPKQLFSFPVKLIEFLNEHKVTTIIWVPSALTIVAKLKAFSFILPETLKNIFFVGETFPIKYLNYWIENLPTARFINLYGSSETAGVICRYLIPHKLDETQKLPIGKPFDGCNIFLVNEDGVLSESGEMIIESNSLALCYYGDEEKTSQKFITKNIDGKMRRFFRSGDLASYDKDGNLLFVSRNDFQIKHMGHRIELGDIETSVYSISEIEDCCCVYDSDKQRIILYVKFVPEKNLDEKTLRNILSQKLPDYMRPSRYVILDEIPKNKNGKTDRQKLKEMI